MLSKIEPHRVSTDMKMRPIVGIPADVIGYRVRLRPHHLPVIFLRFKDRVQKHILGLSGDNWEPFEAPEAVNLKH